LLASASAVTSRCRLAGRSQRSLSPGQSRRRKATIEHRKGQPLGAWQLATNKTIFWARKDPCRRTRAKTPALAASRWTPAPSADKSCPVDSETCFRNSSESARGWGTRGGALKPSPFNFRRCCALQWLAPRKSWQTASATMTVCAVCFSILFCRVSVSLDRELAVTLLLVG
jgi:hypothetical protein